MFWRALEEPDLDWCAHLDGSASGDELIGRNATRAVWRGWLKAPAFVGIVAESQRPIHGDCRVGYAAAAFVRDDFAEEELAAPRPGLNARIVASAHAGRSVVLSLDELRAANTDGGLTVVFLDALWRRDVLTPEQIHEYEAVVGAACLESFRGYRLRRALREATDQFALDHVASQRAFHTMVRVGATRAIFVGDGTGAPPGSVPSILHSHNEPSLWLHARHQALLANALKGATDDEQSVLLGISLPAVKKRWRALFDHIDEMKPDLLPVIARGSGGRDPEMRGRPKRGRLLAYVRQHPEELRPLLSPRRRPETMATGAKR